MGAGFRLCLPASIPEKALGEGKGVGLGSGSVGGGHNNISVYTPQNDRYNTDQVYIHSDRNWIDDTLDHKLTMKVMMNSLCVLCDAIGMAPHAVHAF